ncbi:protein S100-A5 [Delphinapterus leucas]|uniref:Protein S100-A5 n=1 Tax=Delphinapterus leucas TaxID=9749 RepID=A0A2Y9M7I6_DELLE|nr:protein S100-A5 [Delphinapterus leucas]
MTLEVSIGPPPSLPRGWSPPELHTMLETSLEKALTTVVTTFHKYSGREGSKLTLSRKELKELIEKDLCLGELMQQWLRIHLPVQKNKQKKEYSVFPTTLCVAYNDFFLADNQ